MNGLEALEQLQACLARLPGVGRRSAERMAMKLVRDPDGLMRDLGASLDQARGAIRCCSVCGSVTHVEADPCRLCTSPSRDDALLCVVEDPNDILQIERSGEYRGRYHALMGKLSPMKGEGPANLRLQGLRDRVAKGSFKEVVLALGTDVEGDSTASMVHEHLAASGVNVTRIAYGLPAGSGVGYSDPVTLGRAMRGRQGV